jgi:protein-disulfide isomerase
MSNVGAGDRGLSKNERREAAREKARVLREEQKKKERRNKALLQGGLIVVSLAIVAGIALVIFTSIRPPAPGPANMLSDGIKIGQGFTAVTTAGLQPDETPVPSETNDPDVIDLQVYLDYQCPICGEFEATNAEQIAAWVEAGAATVEYHPISILDRVSMGTKYSTRSANAAACVANYSPDSYFDYNAVLFANQPAENTTGLSDKQLSGFAKDVEAKALSSITKCINDQSFKSWVTAATTRATSGPIAGTDVAKVEGTPTVIINGKKYTGPVDDADAFAAAVATAAGQSFTQETPTPTPTPAP